MYAIILLDFNKVGGKGTIVCLTKYQNIPKIQELFIGYFL